MSDNYPRSEERVQLGEDPKGSQERLLLQRECCARQRVRQSYSTSR